MKSQSNPTAVVTDISDALLTIKRKYEELTPLLSEPQILANPRKYREIAKQHTNLGDIIKLADTEAKIHQQITELNEILEESDDPELIQLAQAEKEELTQKAEDLHSQLRRKLLPRDPNDERNVILELRAGTGGEESALFVADLYRMYSHYSERYNWKIDVLSSNPTELGGFKELILSIEGDNAYSRLKYEAGVHRVQRIPVTESQGRIHTSAATVAVLPEAEEVEVVIDPEELRIDVFRSTGPGGQSVNTTDSAVRITHLPTGMVVTCQDEKSQIKNKSKALKVLRARLLEHEQKEQHAATAAARKSMVGTGDRSEKIRTYNYPQNRITDHRIGLTLYKLETILDGDLDELIDALAFADEEQMLAQNNFSFAE